MFKKIAAVILTALATLVLASPAGATGDYPQPCDGAKLIHNECPPAPESVIDSSCPDSNVVGLHIAERRPRKDPKFQTVTVTATNSNPAGSDAWDVELVVTYQANRPSSQARTVLFTEINGGETFTALFQVPRFRDVDGRVEATIEDLDCDHLNEFVSLA